LPVRPESRAGADLIFSNLVDRAFHGFVIPLGGLDQL
jgi:hypothetical protein